MSYPKTTLFLTTYNWPEALTLCIRSIAAQTVLPNEVIIADDGSRNETTVLINQLKNECSFPIVHVWQEDDGYRINAIRNKAILAANNPYIIQIDGDIVLDAHFIEDHLRFAQEGRLVIGRRVNISKERTEAMCKTNTFTPITSFRNKIVAILHHTILYNATNIKGVRGCNMAYWRKDAFATNGYDEEMTGKGPDDKEFAVRLINSGVKAYNLKFYAIANHLHHGDEDLRANYKKNQTLFANTISTTKIKCTKGLTQNV